MTRDELMQMARESGFTFFYSAEEECMRVVPRAYAEVCLERFANLVAEKEREACAIACEAVGKCTEVEAISNAFAAHIRARGQE